MSTSTLYTNGRILTMVDPDDRPEAVLVRDGRIAFVGPLDQARAEATVADVDQVPGTGRASATGDPVGAQVTEVDLDGRTLMPSFIDPHGHLYTHGVLASMVDLEHATSMAEVIEAFRERASREDDDGASALVGVKYDLDVLAEGRHPTRQELDEAAADRPVMAFHRSLHVGAVNSRAQLGRIQELVESGVEEGAELYQPACELPSRGFWFPPSYFSGVAPSHRVAREEIFGPVLAVLPFGDEDEACALADATDYGLGVGIHTRDIDLALRVAGRVDAGYVMVNEYFAGGPGVPFGGRKLSGSGRERGLLALDSYVSPKELGTPRDAHKARTIGT